MKPLILSVLLSMTSLAVMAQTPEVGSDSLSMHRAAAQQDSLGTVLYSKGQFTEAQRCFREAPLRPYFFSP